MEKINGNKVIETLELMLSKNYQSFTDEDLDKIEGITLYPDTGDSSLELSDVFNLLPKLKKVILEDFTLDVPIDINVDYYQFVNCSIKNGFQLPEELKSLSLRRCNTESYEFLNGKLNNLEEMYISYPEDNNSFDMHLLTDKNSLHSMSLESVNVVNDNLLGNLTSLNDMSLLGTKLSNEALTSISNLTNLKTLYINEEYADIKNNFSPDVKVAHNYFEYMFMPSEGEKKTR